MEDKLMMVLLDVVQEVDYDIYKNYLNETAEEGPEQAECLRRNLMSVFKESMNNHKLTHVVLDLEEATS